MHHPDVQRVLAPTFLVDHDEVDIERLYERRDELHRVEGQVSYVRRLAQGRIEILCAELERRDRGGDPSDLADLICALPDVLGGGASVPSTRGGEALQPDDSFVAQVDAVVGPGTILNLPDQSVAEIDGQVLALEGFERMVSDTRRRLHERIDVVQCEIARRFKSSPIG
jgi:hypothetical protein